MAGRKIRSAICQPLLGHPEVSFITSGSPKNFEALYIYDRIGTSPQGENYSEILF